MATLTANGMRLAYSEAGSGPAVVWVHGTPADRHSGDQVAPLLSERYRMIAYDRRGHSESERPSGPVSVADHADDLASLLEQLAAVPAHLVAISYGGLVALTLAVRRPELVASVCLQEAPPVLLDDPAVLPGRDHLLGLLRPVVAEVERGDHDAAARRFAESVLGPDSWAGLPEPLRRTFVHNMPTLPGAVAALEQVELDRDELSALNVPVLVVEGGQSEPMLTALGESLAATLPNARRHLIPDAAHLPHITHPAEFAGAVTAFLDDAVADAGTAHRRG